MIVSNTRYFTVDRSVHPKLPLVQKEILLFSQVCRNADECEEPRAVALPAYASLGEVWLLISISNPVYEVPTLPYTYEDKLVINRDLELETVQVPVAPILNEEYYNSLYWNPLYLPVKAGFTEVTEQEYLQTVIDYTTAALAPPEVLVS